MAYYLVRARPRAELLPTLEDGLRAGAYSDLQPFGRALTTKACAMLGLRPTEAFVGRRKTTVYCHWRKSAAPYSTGTSRISQSRRSSRGLAGGRSTLLRACFPPW